MGLLRVLGAVLFAVMSTGTSAEDTAIVGYDCHGNAVEACYIHVNGRISNDVVDKVQREIDGGAETFQVLLNGGGGDLIAGLALGRVIRSAELQTRIGIYQDQNFPLPGECSSACAYAFLGGTQRILRQGDRIGFHQFASSHDDRLGDVGGVVMGQRFSGVVTSYMVEMGIDARLFAEASETAFSDMYYPGRDERVEYNVETPIGFSSFFMEPYDAGVVVASRRLGPTTPYDRVDQLTVYCRGGRSRALLTVEFEGTGTGGRRTRQTSNGDQYEVAISQMESPEHNEWIGVSPRHSDVRLWETNSGFYIEIAFDDDLVPVDDNALWFRAYLHTSRAGGGRYQAVVELSDMDRRMLRAAFRMCI